MLPITRKALIAPAAALLLAAAASAKTQNSSNNSMAVRETIDRSVALSPGAEVLLETIAGPVTVETGNGSTAQVHIVRGAATARELKCYRTEVTATPGRLAIRHVQDKSRGCNSIRSGQQVRLTLPRSVNLSMSSIAGDVDIGPLDGKLKLSSMAGQVKARAVRWADISSVAGGLSLTVGPLDRRGIRVSSVVGPTDITFARGANADIRVDSVMGNTTSTSPRIAVRWDNGRASARVGAGGSPVTVSSVVGHVTFHGG
jgi:hypothetical protein